ncbi:MAG: hypothetical protein IPM58_12725 [Nitrospira sp.]|nr:hypothetical protein [Nitrospira sp.]
MMASVTHLDSPMTMHTLKEACAPKSRCHRCGGFLVEEQCLDFYETQHYSWYWATRCIQCGDVVDAVTLRNRAKRLPSVVSDTTDPLEIIRNAMEQAA